MKMETAVLKDRALDYIVHLCEGGTGEAFLAWEKLDKKVPDIHIWLVEHRLNEKDRYLANAHYSTSWKDGGPIIERGGVNILCMRSAPDPTKIVWYEANSFFYPNSFKGETPLIAAMRCYVASKLGDEVEIPEELI